MRNYILLTITLLNFSIFAQETASKDSTDRYLNNVSKIEKIDRLRSLMIDAIIEEDYQKIGKYVGELRAIEGNRYIGLFPYELMALKYLTFEFEEVLQLTSYLDTVSHTTNYKITPTTNRLSYVLRDELLNRKTSTIKTIKNAQLNDEKKQVLEIQHILLIANADTSITQDSLNYLSKVFLDQNPNSKFRDFVIKNAYFDFAELINYEEKSEDIFMNAPFFDDTVKFTSRLRKVYYYGLAFNAATPEIEIMYGNEGLFFEKQYFNNDIKMITYNHLTARSNENLIGDNPSPYLTDSSNSREIDLGHLLYGLQALIFPLSQTNTSLSLDGFINIAAKIYKAYNLESIHLAGWVADVGISVGYNERHKDLQEKPIDLQDFSNTNIHFPENPDIDRYYEISAPEADLEGDIDAYGLYKAWQIVLGNNANAKLSDVLKFYYQNPSPSSNITNDNFNCYENRYFIFCLKTGITSQISGNNYSWPDYQNIPTSLLEPIEWMASFWVDHYNGKYFMMKKIKNLPTKKNYTDNTYVLIKFLQWLKAKVQSEQTSMTFT